MAEQTKSSKATTRKFEMTPEHLSSLDKETLIDLLVKVHEQYKQLSETVQAIMIEKYGPKSEKFQDPDQLRLFDNSEITQSEDESGAGATGQTSGSAQASPGRDKPRKRRNPRPAQIDAKPVRGPAPSAEMLLCGCCNVQRKLANEVSRGLRYIYKPAEVFAENYIASIFQCDSCGDTLVVEPDIAAAELKIQADPGLQAIIAVERFDDSLPLNRQERRFARIGVPIARSTMCGWLRAATITLRPLYNEMKTLLLRSKWIATDDTPIKVQDRSKQKNIKLGRVWIYRGDDDHPVNLFDYTTGRGRDGPMEFLREFRGYLLGDCFSGNQALCAATGSTHVACNAHARRYFIKAEPNNRQGCSEILRMYRELFKVDRDAREIGVSGNELKRMREEESRPILDRMKSWLDRNVIVALPKSSFGKAVNYALNNWTELTNFMLDGDLSLDNNLAEQEMKRVAINRKNSLFFGSDRGGEDAEVLMSLISTCRRHDVEPWSYLRDVITILTRNPSAQLNSLMPQNWKGYRQNAEIEMSAIPQS
jgi:transposase